LGHTDNSAWALCDLGNVAFDQGNLPQAAALYMESLVVFHEREDLIGIAACLDGLAGAAGAQGRPVHAARLFGIAQGLRGVAGDQSPLGARADYEHDVVTTRAQLEPATFDAARAEGRAMTLEQAIAYALDNAGLIFG
jgi:hypothetical protein